MDDKVKEIITSSLGKARRCNCYQSLATIDSKILSGIMDIIEEDEMVLLIENKESYSELFYFLSADFDFENVVSDNKLAGYKNLVMHYTSKEKNVNFEMANHLGLTLYKTYNRLQFVNKNQNHLAESLDIRMASIDDLDSMYFIITETLDVMSDDIVSTPELETMIDNAQVLVYDEDGEIKGLLIFEDTGVKTYIRAVCVKPDARGKGIGAALLVNYYNLHIDTYKLFTLWVWKDNIPANKMYENVGYREDGLVDYIYYMKK